MYSAYEDQLFRVSKLDKNNLKKKKINNTI